LITAQVPAATDGTIVAVTNGTVTAQLMEKRQAARDRINELQTKLEVLRAKSN
jgi:hypothetical protein